MRMQLQGLQRFNRTNAAPTFQQLMMRDLSVAQMRAAAPLSVDAQRTIDRAVVRVGMQRLTLVADLIAEGLVFNIDDPLGTTELMWDYASRAGGAQRTMNPSARGENQLPEITQGRIPIFLTTDDFFMGIRTLRSSRRNGTPLDTSMVESATRNVNEAIEDQAINGAGFNVAGMSAPGLLNAPNVNTVTYETNTAWDAAGKTGEEILTDVLAMAAAAEAGNRYGPFNLYIPTTYGNKLNTDFKANGSLTILQRLEQLKFGGRNLRIRVADKLPANRTALVQMTNDVIDLVDGQRPVTVPWTSPDGFTLYWLVMAIEIVRVKTDAESKSGIVIGNV